MVPAADNFGRFNYKLVLGGRYIRFPCRYAYRVTPSCARATLPCHSRATVSPVHLVDSDPRSRLRHNATYRENPATTAAFFLGYAGATFFFALTIWR